MGLKFRRGTTAQQSGSLAFGEPYVNTTLGTLVVGGATGDIVLSSAGTGSTGNFGAISGSGLDITGNANIAGNLTLGGAITIGDATADTVNVVASLSSSLIPQTTNAFDLGSATKIWRDLYISTGSIKFVSNGTVISTLSANADGSQNFPSGAKITGSLIVSGSNIEFTRDWPAVGTESHFLRLAPFTGSDGRYYDGLGIGVEHFDDGTGTYEHSLQIHTWDNHENSTYGSELNVGPYRSHMRMYPSGSGGNPANVSVQDLKDGTSQALVYGDFVQIGAVIGESIIIGNSGSVVEMSGSIRVTSLTGSIAATNGVVSGSSQVDVMSTTNITRLATTGSNSFIGNQIITGSLILSSSADVELEVIGNTVITGSLILSSSLATELIVIGNQVNTGILVVSGSITATGDVVAFSTSDKRHKNTIVLISDALSKVSKLNGVTWEWNDDVDSVTKETPKTGLIAQEVQEVLPEVVKERGDGFLALDYSKMMGLMVEAIKEQQQHIDNLTIQVEELKKSKGL
jgi:hypothetical protein